MGKENIQKNYLLRHFLGHFWSNPDTGTVEPVGADVTTNIEPGNIHVDICDGEQDGDDAYFVRSYLFLQMQ